MSSKIVNFHYTDEKKWWSLTATAVELTVQIDTYVSILWAYWVGFAPSIGPLISQPPYLTLPNQRMVHGKLQGKAPNPNPKTSICTVKPTAVTVAV